jgi:hypothetical protein
MWQRSSQNLLGHGKFEQCCHVFSKGSTWSEATLCISDIIQTWTWLSFSGNYGFSLVSTVHPVSQSWSSQHTAAYRGRIAVEVPQKWGGMALQMILVDCNICIHLYIYNLYMCHFCMIVCISRFVLIFSSHDVHMLMQTSMFSEMLLAQNFWNNTPWLKQEIKANASQVHSV